MDKTFKITYKYTCEKCGTLSRKRREYCRVCGAQALRKATKNDYRKFAEILPIEVKEDLQKRAKFLAMVEKLGEILQALKKNQAEQMNLLKRKKAGESVEDLIAKNRREWEKLRKEDEEHCEISNKWMSTEEGKKTIAGEAMRARLNPNFNRNFRTKQELKLKIATLIDKIQKNEEEYEKLLERRNKGDYIDDLIKQNRYAAESLKNSKESCEKAMGELRTGKRTDWKSKIVR